MTPLRVFIGYDAREPLAYHVLAHSILTRATVPVAITPLVRQALAPIHSRPRGETESTDFSITRFLVPSLCGYDGMAVYLDCDMLCQVDLDQLRDVAYPHRAVWVAQHDYTPKTETKFLGQSQLAYPRKNWSSVMVFNAARCRMLTPEYVNQASGLELHRFHWLPDREIGALPLEWNWLVGEYAPNLDAKLLHYTLGGPWFHATQDCDHANLWWAEKKAMGA